MSIVTLKEIAQSCGCSVATVSKALNGLPDIGRDMTQRVCRCAAKMGYQPNAAARTLKTNRSRMIGLLMFLDGENVWTHEYYGSIAAAIQRELEENGYDLAPIDCGCTALQESYLGYCRYRNYDGVVLMSSTFADPRLKELLNSAIPLVTIDYAIPSRSAAMSDNQNGVGELVEYIHHQGHRRIALLHGEDSAVTRSRLDSFWDACGQLGLRVGEEYVIPVRYRCPTDSAKATCRLLELSKPPTCILYPDDYSLIGGLNVFRQRGIRVPEDISVAGYDGIALGACMQPPLTTVKQDGAGIGLAAARLILNGIKAPQGAEPRHITLPSALVKGGTVATIHH